MTEGGRWLLNGSIMTEFVFIYVYVRSLSYDYPNLRKIRPADKMCLFGIGIPFRDSVRDFAHQFSVHFSRPILVVNRAEVWSVFTPHRSTEVASIFVHEV